MNRLPLRFVLTVVISFLALVNGWAADPVITVRSEPGDPLLQGLQATVIARAYRDSGMMYFTSIDWAAENDVTVALGAPAGGPLHVGVYEDAIDRSSSREEDLLPNLRAFRSEFAWDESPARGRFEVLKVTYSRAGSMTALHATFSLRRDGAAGGLSGEIRYNIDSTDPTANQSPGVFAGDKLYVLPGTPVVLPAVVSDDNLPLGSQLSYSWSGPGSVTFDNAKVLRPTATFSSVGSYSLYLYVSDGALSNYSELSVYVLPPGIESVIRISSAPGERCFGGHDFNASRFDGPLGCSTISGTDLHFGASTRAGYAYFDLSNLKLTPDNLMAPGIYPIVSGYDTITLFISSPKGYSFSDIKGTLDLRRLAMDANGEITELWMYLSVVETQTGDNTDRPLLIEVRYGMPEGAIPDQSPLVTAGSDQTVMQRQRATLAGNVLCDGAVPPTLAWTMVSGPGDVQFADPAARVTEVSFSELGTYVLRLTADDGVHVVSDDVTIEKSARETSLIFRGLPIAAGESSFAGVYTAEECKVVPSRMEYNRLEIGVTVGGYLFFKVKLDAGYFGPGFKPGIYHCPSLVFDSPYAVVEYYNPSGSVGAQSFVIRELEVDDNGNVIALHAEVESDPLWSVHYLRAEIRYNASSLSVAGQNHAPRVSVAEPHTVPNRQFKLDGIVADDGLPEDQPFQITWEQIGGPAGAEIDDPHCLRPSVKAPKGGIYRFRLTASDGDLAGSAESLIVVQADAGPRQYRGLINLKGATLGQFTVTRSGNDSFTARLKLPGTSFPLIGKFEDGRWETSIRNASGQTVWFNLLISPDGTGVVGSISLDGQDWELVADQTQAPALAVARQKADRAGNYNLFLDATDSATPTGFGFARVKVGRSGSARGVARLPDGTPVLFGSTFTIADELPFFTALYGGKGSLAGALEFEGSSIGATLSWLHPERPNHPPFTAGFFSRVKALGDRYMAPGRGSNILSQKPVDRDSLLKAEFIAGNEVFRVPLRFNANGSVTPLEQSAGFSFVAKPRTGLFRGTFRDSRDGKKRSFTGILNPAHTAAAGFFMTSEGSGRVMLSGAQ